ncbi:MAG: CBS domain-containing protein [Nitrososphaerota archaeon]|nr:CBS domain-containing protein [Nitrososphaerota archaeon]
MDSDKLVGIFTLADPKKVSRRQMTTTKLDAVMSKEPVVGYPEETLPDVLSRMSTNKIGRVPIVSRMGHKLLGIVTSKGVADVMTSMRYPSRSGVKRLKCEGCGAPFKEYNRVEKCSYCGTVNTKW